MLRLYISCMWFLPLFDKESSALRRFPPLLAERLRKEIATAGEGWGVVSYLPGIVTLTVKGTRFFLFTPHPNSPVN